MHVYISAQLCVCDCVCVSVSPWGHSTAAQHEARKVRGGGIGIHQDAPAAWNYIRSLGLTYRKLVYVFSNCRARRNRIEAIRCNHLPWESRNVIVESRCFGYLITRECLKVFFHHAFTFFPPTRANLLLFSTATDMARIIWREFLSRQKRSRKIEGQEEGCVKILTAVSQSSIGDYHPRNYTWTIGQRSRC